MRPSEEQQAVIGAPLVPLAVIACAGSGKTFTAVRRLVELRRRLGESRGRVSLLSFSNVAVNTFRQAYQALSQSLSHSAGRNRVEIDTLDAFLTTHVLRPHAHRIMGAARTPFLISGGEPFVSDIRCQTTAYPISMDKVVVGIDAGEPTFYFDHNGEKEMLDQEDVRRKVARIGRMGAYTHELGRYWCYQTLRANATLLRALARRFPHILVDEAQDIGVVHQAILELLSEAGVQISLIGDSCQAIYEFAGADGGFLRNYHLRAGVELFELTCNYRSLPSILSVANAASGRVDDPDREEEDGRHSAYFIGYTGRSLPRVLEAFRAKVLELEMKEEDAAILCRSADSARRLSGVIEPCGQGTLKNFVQAALYRDVNGNFMEAFRFVLRGVMSLLINPPHDLMSRLVRNDEDPALRKLRRRLWRFTRDSQAGLPAAVLPGASQWHPVLLERVRQLLDELQREYGLVPVDHIGRKLARTGLVPGPLDTRADVNDVMKKRLRASTVHRAKGESIDAVLYVATGAHSQAMLDGVDSELGRIGYVALTRARNLLWLAVPTSALRLQRQRLTAMGFRESVLPRA
ncbi:UvrD-helicase domain-containing protein [Pseudoduganella violaceinigra]|uniref:UvrD-helicase domain-containing protein n=1 Tax=Pseudoduganella violaceinigra TaxID=246602 RepID=UPI00041B37DA|nr:ATP-dependent helicase [Pseudoduganella violaceinigra]